MADYDLSRRQVWKQIAATAAIGPLAAAAIAAASSPIRQAIAEYEAAAEAHGKAGSAADEALFKAYPDPMTRPDEGGNRPAHIERLYDEAKRSYRLMDAAYTRVVETPCQSLTDCVAVLEWGADDADIAIDLVLPCLRRLGGAA